MGLRDRWWPLSAEQAIELARAHVDQTTHAPWVEPARASRMLTGKWGVMTNYGTPSGHLFLIVSRDGRKVTGGERVMSHNHRS
jgi:hypothetical protein